MILEPVTIQCPHCGLISRHYQVMSGTIFDSETFTDGKTDVISGAYGKDPFLIRCRRCQGFYFFGDHINEQKEDFDDLPGLDYEEHYLEKEDYHEALQQINQLSPEREKWLRTLLWWAINDLIRNDTGWGKRRSKILEFVNFILKPLQKVKWLHYRYPEYRKWLSAKNDNMRRLLQLLDPVNDINDACLSVEIHRELAAFSLARQQLKMISPKNCHAFYRTQKRLLRHRDRFVRKINYSPVHNTQQEVVLVTGE